MMSFQEIYYLSSPNRTRHDEASSLVQYLHPLAIRHGKPIISAKTCQNNKIELQIGK